MKRKVTQRDDGADEHVPKRMRVAELLQQLGTPTSLPDESPTGWPSPMQLAPQQHRVANSQTLSDQDKPPAKAAADGNISHHLGGADDTQSPMPSPPQKRRISKSRKLREQEGAAAEAVTHGYCIEDGVIVIDDDANDGDDDDNDDDPEESNDRSANGESNHSASVNTPRKGYKLWSLFEDTLLSSLMTQLNTSEEVYNAFVPMMARKFPGYHREIGGIVARIPRLRRGSISPYVWLAPSLKVEDAMVELVKYRNAHPDEDDMQCMLSVAAQHGLVFHPEDFPPSIGSAAEIKHNGRQQSSRHTKTSDATMRGMGPQATGAGARWRALLEHASSCPRANNGTVAQAQTHPTSAILMPDDSGARTTRQSPAALKSTLAGTKNLNAIITETPTYDNVEIKLRRRSRRAIGGERKEVLEPANDNVGVKKATAELEASHVEKTVETISSGVSARGKRQRKAVIVAVKARATRRSKDVEVAGEVDAAESRLRERTARKAIVPPAESKEYVVRKKENVVTMIRRLRSRSGKSDEVGEEPKSKRMSKGNVDVEEVATEIYDNPATKRVYRKNAKSATVSRVVTDTKEAGKSPEPTLNASKQSKDVNASEDSGKQATKDFTTARRDSTGKSPTNRTSKRELANLVGDVRITRANTGTRRRSNTSSTSDTQSTRQPPQAVVKKGTVGRRINPPNKRSERTSIPASEKPRRRLREDSPSIRTSTTMKRKRSHQSQAPKSSSKRKTEVVSCRTESASQRKMKNTKAKTQVTKTKAQSKIKRQTSPRLMSLRVASRQKKLAATSVGPPGAKTKIQQPGLPVASASKSPVNTAPRDEVPEEIPLYDSE